MKFSKKDFKEKYKAAKSKVKPKAKEEEVDESLYGLEGGKPPYYSHDEIYTDTQEVPGDKSTDFETGVPIQTDRKTKNVMNKGADFARGGNMGNRWGPTRANESASDLDEASRAKMKELVQELLKQRTKENEFVSDQPVETNDTPTLDQLTDINIINKTEELFKALSISKDTEAIRIVLGYLSANLKQNV